MHDSTYRKIGNWKPAKRRQKDIDATWTKKHGKRFFGYKLSINVDKKYKVIRSQAQNRHRLRG